MRLWSFLFTDATAPLTSARVAAPDRQTACDIMAEEIGIPLCGVPGAKAVPGVICVVIGEAPEAEPRIVSRMYRVPA